MKNQTNRSGKDSTVKHTLYDLPETPLILRQADVMGKDLIPSDPYLFAIEEMYLAARRSGNYEVIRAAEELYTPIENAIAEFVPWHSDPVSVAFDIVQAGHQRFQIEKSMDDAKRIVEENNARMGY